MNTGTVIDFSMSRVGLDFREQSAFLRTLRQAGGLLFELFSVLINSSNAVKSIVQSANHI